MRHSVFHSAITALTVCDTQNVLLPSPEKATNLGYGIWLPTSASPVFTLREYSVDNANVPHIKECPGCTVCLITLECGAQLISKFIKIRLDLQSCDKIPAKRIGGKLSDSLEHLIGAVYELNDLPYFETKPEANIQMIREVKQKLQHGVTVIDNSKLPAIAKPIAHKMTLLKPNLVSKLETYVPIKLSLILTVIVIIGNLLLHASATFLYHRFAILRKFT